MFPDQSGLVSGAEVSASSALPGKAELAGRSVAELGIPRHNYYDSKIRTLRHPPILIQCKAHTVCQSDKCLFSTVWAPEKCITQLHELSEGKVCVFGFMYWPAELPKKDVSAVPSEMC